MAIDVTVNGGTISVPDRELIQYKNINLIGLKYVQYATQINNNFAKLAETDETLAQGLFALSGATDTNTSDIEALNNSINNILALMSTDAERTALAAQLLNDMNTADQALEALINAKVGSTLSEW